VRPDAWIEPAKARGRALQTINVLRDFAPDFDRSPRRVYVPTEILSKCGLVADGLREWRDDVRCRAVVAELVAHARKNLDASAVLAEMVDPACFGVLDGMTRVYEGLLRRIEAEPRAIVGADPVRLSTAAKSMIACGAYLRGWQARLLGSKAKASRA
jgi:phytoene/squalene synthetase